VTRKYQEMWLKSRSLGSEFRRQKKTVELRGKRRKEKDHKFKAKCESIERRSR
jgi:hypothetical protein